MKETNGRWSRVPSGFKLAFVLMLGIASGLAVYGFFASRAYSYLSDDPRTCVNCHIMAPQYATWQHSSHREVASCNDCHVPHDNVLNTYYFKAMDGLRHATIFTLRAEPQNIFIKEAGINVVHNNCKRCHSSLITDSKLLEFTSSFHDKYSDRLCWDCHREVPHGRVKSLSSTPYARVPVPGSPVPSWIRNLNK